MMPLVSIVLIFLDEERFLDDAVRSVLAQTCHDWELLLVDDGSSDRSPEIARGYAQRDPQRIRVLQHPGGVNRGMSASRNLGLSAASSEFVAFLDGDDRYEPRKLEEQLALFASHPAAQMVYGPTLHWHGWTGRAADESRDHVAAIGREVDRLVPPPQLVRRWLGRGALSPATCGCLVRRDAALAVGGFEDRFVGMFEDQVFFYKLASTVPVYVDSGCWDRYRQHEDSACRRALADGSWTQERASASATQGVFLEWLEGHLESRGMSGGRELRERLRPYRHPRRHWALLKLRGARRRARALAGRIRHASWRPAA